jgi:hypothetical protein
MLIMAMRQINLLVSRVVLCSDIFDSKSQQTSLRRTTRETNKCLLPHSHDYRMKILSDFNEIRVTP